MTKELEELEELLSKLPAESKACAFRMWDIGTEFKMTREEFVAQMKARGYLLAGSPDEIVFTKNEAELNRVIAGGDYLIVTVTRRD
jgi:hypothetical protein